MEFHLLLGLYVRSTATVIFGREKLIKKEKPGVLVFGSLHHIYALKCLSCYDVREPRVCDQFDWCEEHEICGIQQYLKGNEVMYSVGCLTKTHCEQTYRTTNNSVRSSGDDYLCRTCCNTDFCNSGGCGAPGYPVSRGPVCYNCDQIRDNSFCHRITVCDQNEECYYSEQSRFGSRVITSKCQRSHICDVLRGESTLIGRRDASTAVNCVHCCSSDMCNENCLGISSTESTKTMFTTTETAYGLYVPSTAKVIYGREKLRKKEKPDISSTESTNSLQTATQPVDALSTGYQFLLMFLKNFGHKTGIYDQMLISSNSNGWCVIQNNFDNISQNVTINKGINVFNFSADLKMNKNIIESKSIVIEASTPVSLFAMNYDPATSDGYLALPSSRCSTHYKVPSYTPNFDSLIGVGSIHNRTNVYVTLHLNGGTVNVTGNSYQDGDTITLTLQMYETFQVTSDGDLTGTEIVSSHPVCIVSGAACPDILSSGCSHISEMILPVSQFSTYFIIPVLYTRRQLAIRAITQHNQMSVTFDHQTISMPRDGYHEFISDNTNMNLISSTEPILVTLYSGDDPFMMSIPAVSQYLYDYLFAVPDAGFTSYLSVVIRDNELSGLRLDNNSIVPIPNSEISNDFNNVRYSTFTVNVTPGAHNMHHVHEEPFGLFVYGFRISDGYGYPAGIRF